MRAIVLKYRQVQVLSQALEIMSDNAPLPQASILQMIDWRLAQMQQGFVMHSAGIKSQMNERFCSLENSISCFCAEIVQVKEKVISNTEEIKELKEDNGSITERLEQLERKFEMMEQSMKACSMRVMNVREDDWEDEHTTT